MEKDYDHLNPTNTGLSGPVGLLGPNEQMGRANYDGLKADRGKLRWDLLPPEIERTVEVLTYGAGKYEPRGWEKGIAYGRIYSAMVRHLQAWLKGEKIDPETGLPHLAHAHCNLTFLLAYEERGMGPTLDDLTRAIYPPTSGGFDDDIPF